MSVCVQCRAVSLRSCHKPAVVNSAGGDAGVPVVGPLVQVFVPHPHVEPRVVELSPRCYDTLGTDI